MDKDQKLQELDLIETELVDIQRELVQYQEESVLEEELNSAVQQIAAFKKAFFLNEEKETEKQILEDFNSEDPGNKIHSVDLTALTGQRSCKLKYAIIGFHFEQSLKTKKTISTNFSVLKDSIVLPQDSAMLDSEGSIYLNIMWCIEERWQAHTSEMSDIGMFKYLLEYKIDAYGEIEYFKAFPKGHSPVGKSDSLTKVLGITHQQGNAKKTSIDITIEIGKAAVSASDDMGAVYTISDASSGANVVHKIPTTFILHVETFDMEQHYSVVYFDVNSHSATINDDLDVKKWWKSLPEEIQDDIKDEKIRVDLNGTASVPGGDEINLPLSKKRAKHIEKVLREECGAGQYARITWRSASSDDHLTEEEHGYERRVEIILKKID